MSQFTYFVFYDSRIKYIKCVNQEKLNKVKTLFKALWNFMVDNLLVDSEIQGSVFESDSGGK